MPSTTFLNLKKEKREKIDSVLLDAFYDKHVSQVKVSMIVEKSGISRGAFYKYFQDLEDAYTYMLKKCSVDIHADILTFINQHSDNFFYGLEVYLIWCSECEPSDVNWKKIKLCTQSNLQARMKRRTLPEGSSMMKQWFALLSVNDLNLSSSEEAVSFLYFIMALVMDSLTDYISNSWDTAELLEDFRYRIKWVQFGLK